MKKKKKKKTKRPNMCQYVNLCRGKPWKLMHSTSMNYYYIDDTTRRSLAAGRRTTTRRDGPIYYQANNTTGYSPTYLMPATNQLGNNYLHITKSNYGPTYQDSRSLGKIYPQHGNYNMAQGPQVIRQGSYYDRTYGNARSGSRIAMVLAIIILALAMATGIALGIYFSIYAGDDSTTTTTEKPSTTVTLPVPTIPFGGILTLPDLTFATELDNPSSPEFDDLATQFCDEMARIYSAVSLNLIGCDVHNFINGSVKVNYTLNFENVGNSDDPTSIREVKRTASSSLVEAIDEGTEELTITTDSIEFEDDGDDCEGANCEQICEDDYFTFTCSCNDGYTLQDDDQACSGTDVSLVGVVTLDDVYDEALADISSDVYQEKENYVCQELDKVFESGSFAIAYTGCAVNNFLNGSVVSNLTLAFKVPSLTNVTEFLEDVEEEVEGQIENNDIFSDETVTYVEFGNDIEWCHYNPSVCGQRGCDSIQCICEDDEFYHGDLDCRDEPAIELTPGYADDSTIYLSTEPVPDSHLETSYHIIVCDILTNATDSEGGLLVTTWTDHEGNNIPLYPNLTDTNGVNIDVRSFRQASLSSGTWMLEFPDVPQTKVLAFSSPESDHSGLYSCYAEGVPDIEISVNIEFVDCTSADSYFMCSGGKQCILHEQLCDNELHCVDLRFQPKYVDELFCNCTVDSFACANEVQCVPPEARCDAYGKYECADRSDQEDCSCTEDTYGCTSKDRCIPRDWLCDGESDCPDNDDESVDVCETVCDEDTEYLCTPSSACISQTKLCDGYYDCPGRDDEDSCTHVCSADEISCPGLDYICIDPDHLCDGLSDCPNDGDELQALCGCDFQCSVNGSCLTNSSLCDGQCDCAEDCADELGCNCTSNFQCNNTQCLRWPEAVAFCNGEIDCLDGSDEPENCSCTEEQFDCGYKCITLKVVCDDNFDCDPALFNYTTSLDELNCNCSSPDLFTCDNGNCVNPAAVCNFQDNCGDYSDEVNCSYCEPDNGWFVCPGHGMCIYEEFACDGVPHCINGTDELNCPECLFDTFKCVRNGEEQCLPREWLCDGVEECDSGEDEFNCENCTEYVCSDYEKCLNYSQQCDGVRDCSDGSDEWQCLRVDEDTGVLKFFDGASREVIPVCGNSWDINNNQKICDILGMGLSLGHQVVSNSEDDTTYLLYGGDTPALGTMEECGGAVQVKVMCEKIECGKRSENLAAGFIIEGEEASLGAWPWQIVLFVNGHFQCGGTLVDDEWVVTAAHCVQPPDANIYTIQLGSNLREEYDPNRVVLTAAAIIPHPDYNDRTLHNDIAMIKLAEKATFTDYIRPACIAEHRYIPDSTSLCYTTGFGTINKVNPYLDRQIVSDVLLEAKMIIHPIEICEELLQLSLPRMLCSGYRTGSKSTCNGDSGGPLVCLDEHNTWTLVGVTSWGLSDPYTNIFCRSHNGFTDVALFGNWIKQQMQLLLTD